MGQHYKSLAKENRMLIVGERVFLHNHFNSIKRQEVPTYAKAIIEQEAIARFYYGTILLPHLHRALFRNDEFELDDYWNLVSFYNFIQRPMKTNSHLPTYIDFYNGWSDFFKVVKVLQPKTCLFLGTSASNALTQALKESEFSAEEVKWKGFINNTFAKTTIIKRMDQNEIELIFISHKSETLSWGKWYQYLQRKISYEKEWFDCPNRNT